MTFRSHLPMFAAATFAAALSVTLVAPAEARPRYPTRLRCRLVSSPRALRSARVRTPIWGRWPMETSIAPTSALARVG